MKISIPSKTFIIGEYFILNPGCALLANTAPRFELSIEVNQSHEVIGIHDESPAGKFIRDHAFFADKKILFKDPYDGAGGFGASSAQFLGVFLLNLAFNESSTPLDASQRLHDTTGLSSHELASNKPSTSLDPGFRRDDIIGLNTWLSCKRWLASRFLESYLQYAWDGEGIAPSGADLISQMLGNICLVDKQQQIYESSPWPFQDLSFYLLKTPFKVATHQHLQHLKSFDFSIFETYVRECIDAFKTSESVAFVANINKFQNLLSQNKLTFDKTELLIHELKKYPGVKAVKGCGAQGADVILILFDPNLKEKLKNLLSQYQIISSELDVSTGVELKIAD